MDGLPEYYYGIGEHVLCFETEENAWHRAQILDVQTESEAGQVIYLVHCDGWSENEYSWVTNGFLRPDHQTQSYDETGSDLNPWGFNAPPIFEYFIGGETSGSGEQPPSANQAVVHISIHEGNAHIKLFDKETGEQVDPINENGQKPENETDAATLSKKMPAELANVSASSNVTELWPIYKAYFNKTSYDPDEDKKRFLIFQGTVKSVVEQNQKYARGVITYTSGLNQFSDWTMSEVNNNERGTLE